MDAFKLVTWNLEHADRLVTALDSTTTRTRERAEDRADAIRDEIAALAPDILLVQEGPMGEARARAFFERVAPGHDLVVRGDDDRKAYGMQGNRISGGQWLWFLIGKGAPITGTLLHLDSRRALVERESQGAHKGGEWGVSFPRLEGDHVELRVEETHSHWRHPQVLLATVDGHPVEIVGAHLKSKFSRVRPVGDPHDDAFFSQNPALVADIVTSRIKLATEAADIRHYVDQRFAENASAAIVIAGDFNDGPGKERIERRFLYHDLIGALQGEVFFARRFLNHALFDAPETERWSVHFEDDLDPGRDPRILLDHILFSQSFTGNPQVTPFAFRAPRGGGKVEHDVHHAVNGARPSWAETSDHKPVSMRFERRRPEAAPG